MKGKYIIFPKLSSLILSLITLLFCVPIFVIFGSLFYPNNEIWQHLIDTVLLDYLSNSFYLVIGVSFLSLLLGIIPAWLLAMYNIPFGRFLEWGLLLPMAIPAYIIAYSYTGALDATGPVQALLREITNWSYNDYWFPEIRSLGGAIIMLSLVLYPYVYMLARAAFIEQSICVLEVSKTLGCNNLSTFLRVGLPLARPAIIVGLSLVVMETLSDYGTVQYFGISTFTTGIFRAWFGLGSSPAASQLSAILLIFIATFIYLEKSSRKKAGFYHTSSRYTPVEKKHLKGAKLFVAITYCFLPLLLGFIFPVCFLFNLAIDTYTYTLNHTFYKLLVNSLFLGIITSVLALFIALIVSYTNRNNRVMLNTIMTNIISMGYAIPGTVIAVGVLIPFAWFDNTIDTFLQKHFAISTGLLVSGTVFCLIFAYLIRFLAVSINTISASLIKIKPVMDEVAKTTNIPFWSVIKRIHIPMMRGSALTVLLLVFVDVIKELPATLVLRPFNFNTLAVRAYELANEELLAEAAVPALTIVAIGILPIIIISKLISESRPGFKK